MQPTNLDTAKRPLVLIWEMTQACDLACKHCRAEAEPGRHPDELTTTEAKALMDDITRFGDNQLLVLSGGDPLIRGDVVELVNYGTNKGLQVTITPSGTSSLTRTKIQELADAGLRRMALSIDGGTATTHDEFRQETGSFEQTITAARMVQEIGLPLQINTTVCAETVDELSEIKDLVDELGAVLWSVFFLVPVGRGDVLDPISPTKAEEVMEWLHEISSTSSFGIKTTEAPHYRRVAIQQAEDSHKSQGRPGITAGDGFAFISHTGEVFPSGFLPQSAGNVRNQSIVDIYRNSELFLDLRDPDNLKGKCGVCKYRQVCGGSRSRAFATTGDPLASDPLCAYIPPAFDDGVQIQEM